MKKLHNIVFNKKALALLSACAITSLLCVPSLQAQPLPQQGPIPFHLYDLNSNGSISQNEFNTIRGLRMENREAQGFPMRNMASEPVFNQFDTDKDGQLNPGELNHGQLLQLQKRWEQRQTQGRQAQGRRGMRQGQGMGGGHKMPQFVDFDQNKDGLLSPEEFTSGMQQHRQNRQNMRQRQGTGMRQGQAGGMRGGHNMPKFADFDGNNDGFISEQELIEARSMRISSRIQQGYQMRNTPNITSFKEIDTNSDGKISPEEFSTHQKQHQMGRQRSQ